MSFEVLRDHWRFSTDSIESRAVETHLASISLQEQKLIIQKISATPAPLPILLQDNVNG